MKRDAIVKSLLSIAHSCLGNFQREIFPIYYNHPDRLPPCVVCTLVWLLRLCDSSHDCYSWSERSLLNNIAVTLSTLGAGNCKTDERHSVHKYTLYNFYRSSTRITAEALTSLFALRSFAVIFYNVAESDSQNVENSPASGDPSCVPLCSYFPAEENRAEGEVGKSQIKQVVSRYQKSIQL